MSAIHVIMYRKTYFFFNILSYIAEFLYHMLKKETKSNFNDPSQPYYKIYIPLTARHILSMMQVFERK